jgi:hypothetical protein
MMDPSRETRFAIVSTAGRLAKNCDSHFQAANGWTPPNRRLQSARCPMKYFLTLCVLIGFSGCMTPPAKIESARPKAATPVASISVHRANPFEVFTGYETRCEIHSLDGVSVVDSHYELSPGNHTLTVSLSHLGRDYVGDVDLLIPEAKRYELRAKRKGDLFMLSIVDTGRDKVIATSTAPLDDHMKFLVFVVQN